MCEVLPILVRCGNRPKAVARLWTSTIPNPKHSNSREDLGNIIRGIMQKSFPGQKLIIHLSKEFVGTKGLHVSISTDSNEGLTNQPQEYSAIMGFKSRDLWHIQQPSLEIMNCRCNERVKLVPPASKFTPKSLKCPWFTLTKLYLATIHKPTLSGHKKHTTRNW